MPGREATVLSSMRAWRVRAQTEEWWLWLEHHRSLVVLEKINKYIFFPKRRTERERPIQHVQFVAFPVCELRCVCRVKRVSQRQRRFNAPRTSTVNTPIAFLPPHHPCTPRRCNSSPRWAAELSAKRRFAAKFQPSNFRSPSSRAWTRIHRDGPRHGAAPRVSSAGL
jgi:hypothetical protein